MNTTILNSRDQQGRIGTSEEVLSQFWLMISDVATSQSSMQGTHCLQYKRLHAGETSAMSNFLRNESWHCLEEAEDDLESHK